MDNNSTLFKNEEMYNDFINFIETEDPYKVLGCSKNDNIEVVNKRFKKVLSKVKSQEIVDKKEVRKIEFAHKILSDQRFRELYDSYMVNSTSSSSPLSALSRMGGYKQQQNASFKTSFLYPTLSILTYGLNSVLIRVQSHKSLINPKEIAKDIYRKRGIGGFYRGMMFSIFLIPTENIRFNLTDFISKRLLSTFNFKLDPSVINLIHDISRIVCLYPITIVLDYILLSPLEMKTLDVLKQTLFKREALYHGFIYYVGLSIFSKVLRDILNKIGHYIYKAYHRNPKSLVLYYLEVAYNNNITKALLHSLLCCPIHCVRTQYPLSVVNYLISGIPIKSIPTPSPLSIAKQIYNSHNGYSKFYNGFGLMFFSKLFTKISMYPVDSIHQSELIFE